MNPVKTNLSRIAQVLSHFRIFKSAKSDNFADALRNAVAGIQLATMNIPQALGYAKIAGMPIVTGFYSLLLPLVAFAAFGSSRFLVVGADSATAAILAGGLAPLAEPASFHYITLASAVALLTSGFLVLSRILKLGFLADFLSHTVLIGFLTGVGFQVAVAVLGDLTGVEIHSRKALVALGELWHSPMPINLLSFSLSCIVITFILTMSRLVPRFPASLIVVASALTASWYFDFAGHGLILIGPVASGLPHLSIPQVNWEEIQAIIPLSASCFVMILAQSAATARVYAARHHQELDVNADLIGLAAANATAALSGTFVVNGSPTQTAMVEASGGRSQLAQLTTALVVVAVLMLLSAPLQYLPRAVLGSLIFCTATRLLDFRGLLRIRRESRGEFVLAMITVLAVVLVGVEEGIILAIVLSLLRIVQHSYRPHTGILVKNKMGLWEPVPLGDCSANSVPGVVIYRFGASLFYANCTLFAEEVRRIAKVRPPPRWIVIDAEAITKVDYTAARVLIELHRELAAAGVTLVFARVQPYLRADMDRHHISVVIGEKRIFPRLHNAIESYRETHEKPQA